MSAVLRVCQKPSPLSGGSPSPKVLLINARFWVPASWLAAKSAIGLSSTAIPSSRKRAAKRSASASALPVCEAHSRVSAGVQSVATAFDDTGLSASSTRLNNPPSTPSSHNRVSAARGAFGGITGTPPA
ncbi:hypothetical protein D3C87_1305100 [compost metagenome]